MIGTNTTTAPDAGDDAVHQQAGELARGQAAAGPRLEQAEAARDPVLGDPAHHEGERVDRDHDGDEDGDAQPPVGEQRVQARGEVRPGPGRAAQHLGREAMGEAVAPLGDQGGAVGAQVRLQEAEAGLDLRGHRLPHVAALHQAPGGGDALQQLQGEPAGRAGLGQLLVPLDLALDLDQFAFQVVPVVHGPGGPPGLPRHPDGGLAQGLDPLLAVADGGDHRTAQEPLLQGLQVQLQAGRFGVVHHVEGEHHGPAQLEQLGGEVEVALEVGGVQHVDDDVHGGVGHEPGGDPLILALGRKGIGPRKVHHLHLPSRAFEEAAAPLHRDAGPVAHVLARPGQGIEDRGLAAVGVAGQSKGNRHQSSSDTRMHSTLLPPER